MKRPFLLILFSWFALICGQSFGTGFPAATESDVPGTSEAKTLSYLWELHKYQRDRYASGAECWDVPEMIQFADDEQLQMDILGALLTQYDVPFPSQADDPYSYSDDFLDDEALGIRFFTCWGMPPRVHEHSAYVEEVQIQDVRQAILGTDEQALLEAYSGALASAYDHLREMADFLGEPLDYQAQLLGQEDVDEILSGESNWPVGLFRINAGLNDGWFDPRTSGQGFFITVYPDRAMIMVGWLTFDTELPDDSATAKLGDPGQRWLTAQGPYAGNRAELVVYNASGGLFNASPPTVRQEPIGFLDLQFEGCGSGSVTYSLPWIEESGLIPIQRIVPDNIAACESHSQQSN